MEQGVTAVAVLSGNRNFEGPHPSAVRASFLASPPLVVAYALAGSVLVDLEREPLGNGADGRPVYLRELWPGGDEIRRVIDEVLAPSLFARYATCSKARPSGARLKGAAGKTFMVVARQHVHPAPAVLRGHGGAAGRACRHPRRARARASSATCSPPTTSRRSASSRKARRLRSTFHRSASRRRTS